MNNFQIHHILDLPQYSDEYLIYMHQKISLLHSTFHLSQNQSPYYTSIKKVYCSPEMHTMLHWIETRDIFIRRDYLMLRLIFARSIRLQYNQTINGNKYKTPIFQANGDFYYPGYQFISG